jgi:hypothetical protein
MRALRLVIPDIRGVIAPTIRFEPLPNVSRFHDPVARGLGKTPLAGRCFCHLAGDTPPLWNSTKQIALKILIRKNLRELEKLDHFYDDSHCRSYQRHDRKNRIPKVSHRNIFQVAVHVAFHLGSSLRTIRVAMRFDSFNTSDHFVTCCNREFVGAKTLTPVQKRRRMNYEDSGFVERGDVTGRRCAGEESF